MTDVIPEIEENEELHEETIEPQMKIHSKAAKIARNTKNANDSYGSCPDSTMTICESMKIIRSILGTTTSDDVATKKGKSNIPNHHKVKMSQPDDDSYNMHVLDENTSKKEVDLEP